MILRLYDVDEGERATLAYAEVPDDALDAVKAALVGQDVGYEIIEMASFPTFEPAVFLSWLNLTDVAPVPNVDPTDDRCPVCRWPSSSGHASPEGVPCPRTPGLSAAPKPKAAPMPGKARVSDTRIDQLADGPTIIRSEHVGPLCQLLATEIRERRLAERAAPGSRTALAEENVRLRAALERLVTIGAAGLARQIALAALTPPLAGPFTHAAPKCAHGWDPESCSHAVSGGAPCPAVRSSGEAPPMKAARCSGCGCRFIVISSHAEFADDWFCPHCGSDSRSVQLKVPPDVVAVIAASPLWVVPR